VEHPRRGRGASVDARVRAVGHSADMTHVVEAQRPFLLLDRSRVHSPCILCSAGQSVGCWQNCAGDIRINGMQRRDRTCRASPVSRDQSRRRRPAPKQCDFFAQRGRRTSRRATACRAANRYVAVLAGRSDRSSGDRIRCRLPNSRTSRTTRRSLGTAR